MKWFKGHWGWFAALALFLVIIGAWLTTFFFITFRFPKEQWGIIGDLFGSINALFSGLAFAGVVVALFLQQKELKIQQHALLESIKESAEQTRLLREAHQLELTRLKNEGEPIFQWDRSTSNPDNKRCHFTNLGGTFRVTALYSAPALDVRMQPVKGAAITHGTVGWVRVGAPKELPTVYKIFLRCESAAGFVWTKTFQVVGSADPVELPPLGSEESTDVRQGQQSNPAQTGARSDWRKDNPPWSR